jgi:hypothetical protein
MTKDLNLFYHGGSGGFFTLHLLLLTGHYDCKFRIPQPFSQAFSTQWNISSIDAWKSSEVWPHNDKTMCSDIEHKIYFTCGDVKKFLEWPGKKIVIYTDIDTQMVMSISKKAAWFREEDLEIKRERNQRNFVCAYNSIKAEEWTDCESIEQFNELPSHIRDECINKRGFKYHYRDGLGPLPPSNGDGMWSYHNGDRILTKTKTLIDSNDIDIVVKYQDLIKTKGGILFEQLGILGNDACRNFVDMY